MRYILNALPFGSKTFNEMTRKEARAHFEWYLSQIPVRIPTLEKAICLSGDKYHSWKADLSSDSLLLLGEWFAENITICPPDENYIKKWQEKVEALPPRFRKLVPPPTYVLTGRTCSLIIDAGMYLGEVLRKRLPYLKWQLWTRKASFYNKPVLVGCKSTIAYDPEGIVHIFVLRLIDNECEPSMLKEWFDARVQEEMKALTEAEEIEHGTL